MRDQLEELRWNILRLRWQLFKLRVRNVKLKTYLLFINGVLKTLKWINKIED